jgi:hypothetical protein
MTKVFLPSTFLEQPRIALARIVKFFNNLTLSLAAGFSGSRIAAAEDRRTHA